MFTAYRNWMNSLGVSPFVHRLYSDLYDGLILFQLYDYIQPGIVDWKRVIKKFNKMKANFERIGKLRFTVWPRSGFQTLPVSSLFLLHITLTFDLKKGINIQHTSKFCKLIPRNFFFFKNFFFF
jgi:hypothetical protein